MNQINNFQPFARQAEINNWNIKWDYTITLSYARVWSSAAILTDVDLDRRARFTYIVIDEVAFGDHGGNEPEVRISQHGVTFGGIRISEISVSVKDKNEKNSLGTYFCVFSRELQET